MEKIFSIFEKKLKKTKIKIASHFRRSSKDIPISRRFYFDRTLELVKNSKLVLAHGSLALSWAILFNKPVVLITNENFDYISLLNNEEIKFHHKQMSMKMIKVDSQYQFNLDKKFFKNLLKINTSKYEKFKKLHLNFKNNKVNEIDRWNTISKKLREINLEVSCN